MYEINEALAQRVLDTVDAGLIKGMGNPFPGQMCVEAAVCYAMDLPHSDNPICVTSAIRKLKIELNDADWSSDMARAKGLRQIAIAQLGSEGTIDDVEFVQRLIPLAKKAASDAASDAARAASDDARAARVASYDASEAASDAASDAARAAAMAARAASDAASYDASYDASDAASYDARAAASDAASDAACDAARAAAMAARAASDAAGYAASAAASDTILFEFAADVVQILVDMKSPGCQFLYLAKEKM